MFRKLVFAFLGFAVLGAMMTIVADWGKTPEQIEAERLATNRAEEKRHRVGLAEVTCQLAFERRANDPKSIEWLRDERQFAYKNKEETRAVSRQPVRAKNGFGALVLSVVTCDLQRNDDDWRVLKIGAK